LHNFTHYICTVIKLSGKLRKRLRLAFLIAGGLLVLLPLLAFGLRGWLVKRQLSRMQEKLSTQYATQLVYSDFEMTGLSSVRLTGVRLVPNNADTLLTLDTAWVGVRFWPLLTGTVRLADLELAGGRLLGRKLEGRDNLSRFAAKATQDTTADADKQASYAGRLERYFSLLSTQLPGHLVLRRFVFDWHTPTDSVVGGIEQVSLLDGSLAGRWQMNGTTWIAEGQVDPDGPTFDIRLRRSSSVYVPLDGLMRRFGLGFSPTDIHIAMSDVSRGDEVRFNFRLESGLLGLYHKRIHTDTIEVESVMASFSFHVTDKAIELDSTSTLTVNGLTLKPYIYLHTHPDTLIRSHLLVPRQPAQQFFDALPTATFQQLAGIEVGGTLQVGVRFMYATHGEEKDSVDVQYYIKPDGFKVKKYGNGDLTLLQEPFSYKPYFNPSHKLIVGPQNPNYITLNNIDTLLRKCVLYAEDRDFFNHQGFYEQAFELAALTNIKSGSFKRGGSTITMQLVKNVFLKPAKTLARKLEEALLVWLLETQKVVSKQRIFEIYLNIIEWGPNIYGIGEATRYYFNKDPRRLKKEECIFLAMIIPQPRNFMHFFEPDGTLKEFTKNFFKFLGARMKDEKFIDAREYDQLRNNIRIVGPAQALLPKKKTEADTTQVNVENDFFETLGEPGTQPPKPAGTVPPPAGKPGSTPLVVPVPKPDDKAAPAEKPADKAKSTPK